MKKMHLVFLSFVILACSIYGIIGSYTLLFNSKYSNTIKAEGLVLDTNKTYAFTNKARQSERDTCYVIFANKLMPTSLGNLHFKYGEWSYFTDNYVNLPNSDSISKNPFLPWCVSTKDNETFYSGNSAINQKALMDGIKLNSAFGDIKDRISIKLDKYKNKFILSSKTDDAIGLSYMLFNDTTNLFEFYFGKVLQLDDKYPSSRVFSFPFNSRSNFDRYLVKVTNHFWKGPSYEIVNVKTGVSQGVISGREFILNDVLIRIDENISNFNIIIFVLYIILMLLFQFILLKKIYILRINGLSNPFMESILSLKIGFNSMLFLGMPLMVFAMQYHNNRWVLIIGAILLNLNIFNVFISLFSVSKFNTFYTQYLQKHIKRYSLSILWLVFTIGCVFVFFASNSAREAIFGIPALHITKILILLLAGLIQFYPSLTRVNNAHDKQNRLIRLIYRNKESIILLLFSIILTGITKDFGSFVFTFCAILLIEFIKRNYEFCKASFGLVFGIIAVIFLLSFINPSSLKNIRKSYRMIAWIASPDKDYCSWANEEDRQQVMEHYFLIKDKIEDPSINFSDTAIPSNWKNVFFSDYSVIWSIKLGGGGVFLLLITTVFFIVFHFLRIVFLSHNVFAVDDNRVFYFSNTKSKIIVLLLCITLVQFIYPIFSNLLMAPLTGQSLPLLSTSNIEVFFLIILIVSLQAIYNFKDYYYPIKEFSSMPILTLKQVSKKLSKTFLFIIGSFFLLFFIRVLIISTIDNEKVWKKNMDKESFIAENINADNKQEVINTANKFMKNFNLMELKSEQKNDLKNLASFYYTGKPYKDNFALENHYVSLNLVKSRTSYDSLAKTKQNKIIAGDFNCLITTKSINGKPFKIISNKYFSGFPLNSNTVNIELQVLLNKELEKHLNLIGENDNIGCIVISENKSGNIISSASYPFFTNCTRAYVDQYNKSNKFGHRFIYDDFSINTAVNCYQLQGSLVKPLIGAAFLSLFNYALSTQFDSCSFYDFIKRSNGNYSANAFKLLLLKRDALNNFLDANFDLPLMSDMKEAFIDDFPKQRFFGKELDGNNPIYRLSIGQQNKNTFAKIVQSYSRIYSGKKTFLSYYQNSNEIPDLTFDFEKNDSLKKAMNLVFFGTANLVRIELEKYKIDYSKFICKTGTAQKSYKDIDNTGTSSNATSGFILCTNKYTIGIQLAGDIPDNQQRLSAKDLFIKIIPILIKYNILESKH